MIKPRGPGAAGEATEKMAQQEGSFLAEEFKTGMPKGGEALHDLEPFFGRKLDYVFGKATGVAHNIERSESMLAELNKIGIHDTPTWRQYVQEALTETFKNPSNVILGREGRIIKESTLWGPGGVVKVESIWQETKLITVKIFTPKG